MFGIGFPELIVLAVVVFIMIGLALRVRSGVARSKVRLQHPLSHEALIANVRRQHPRFREALIADALITLAYRSERYELRSRFDKLCQILRLMWVSDAFFAQACYRAKARLQALRVPVLPMIFHRLAMITSQVSIGSPVVVQPGIYITHGQVVVDGFVRIEHGVVLNPWVTVGLRAGEIIKGPTIQQDVHIGTGAKVFGSITIGAGARIGANAVVIADVPPGVTVVGVPARQVPRLEGFNTNE